MTRDQYTELVSFLGRKFDGVDQRFDGIDRRFDSVERRLSDHDRQFEEVRRHATVLFERSEANLKVVAEGLGLRLERVEGRLEVLESVRGAHERGS